VQRLGDQPFAGLGPVGVGGVDEVDAQLDCTLEEAMGLLWFLRLLPDPRQAHGAEPDPVDRHHSAKL
jgi:hypothetical protein